MYVEVPAFYAEVERAHDPALAERAVIVGGDPRKRGLVQAGTPDAIAAGVRVGMPMLQALGLCPRARSVRTNMPRYREASARLRATLRLVVDRLEPAGLEAAYLDPSGVEAPVEELAGRLARLVRDELGLPLRVGIAPVKFLARLAAEEAGPEGMRGVPPEEVGRFLHPLPVERLPGVGPRTAQRLAELGARTAGEVLRLGKERLEAELGNHGLAILAYAEGRDPSRLRAAGHPRSVSQEFTFDAAQVDRGVLTERLQALAQSLEAALRRDSLAARRVLLKVRYADLQTTTRSQSVPRPLASAPEILVVASELLERTHAGVRPVRLLGLSLSALQRIRPRDERQLDLFAKA
jgi:DNA polymerase-4